MPDLLKNNHLDKPGLPLVRSVDNITEIWSRMKKAYGEQKMPSKKLQYLYKFDALLKLNDGEKIVEALIQFLKRELKIQH